MEADRKRAETAIRAAIDEAVAPLAEDDTWIVLEAVAADVDARLDELDELDPGDDDFDDVVDDDDPEELPE